MKKTIKLMALTFIIIGLSFAKTVIIIGYIITPTTKRRHLIDDTVSTFKRIVQLLHIRKSSLKIRHNPLIYPHAGL
jgi:hypothetical protein